MLIKIQLYILKGTALKRDSTELNGDEYNTREVINNHFKKKFLRNIKVIKMLHYKLVIIRKKNIC